MGTRVRFTLLIAGAFLVYGALIFRLYDLQLAKGDTYSAKASSQFAASETLDAPRGVIYFTDKNGNRTPVAVNKDLPVVYAVPKDVKDSAAAVDKLLPFFPDLDRDTMMKRMENKKSQYALFGKKVAQDTADKVQALGIKGVYVAAKAERYYTLGTSAGHLLGFVGPSQDSLGDAGRYGVEEQYDSQLRGDPGVLDDGKLTFPRPGEDMNLTIDPNVQAEAQILLTNLVNKYRSTGGTILVQEPKSGKILALVDAPTFDPNDYGKASLESFGNGAIAKQYEPGSVVKVLTMAAGLDAGKFTPDTTVYDDGDFEVSGFHIHNWDLKSYGTVSMTNIIEHSLNVGTSLAQRIEGKDVFLKYINAFGYGQKTGIDLPGEISGDLGEITQKGASEIAWSTASFGQGVAVTPIQVLSAVSALANGGTLMRPYVNAALEPKEVRRVIKPETSRAVAKMMTTAVVTNKIAAIRGYDVAGKTGTAQLAVGGKYGNNVINTYVGFAPSYDPRFSILVKLDQPAGAPLAGQTIVPVFRDLAQFLLTYYEVPPDHPSER